MAIGTKSPKSTVDSISRTDPNGSLNLETNKYRGSFVTKSWYDERRDALAIWDGSGWVYETGILNHFEIDTETVEIDYIEF